jgi:TonB family protein
MNLLAVEALSQSLGTPLLQILVRSLALLLSAALLLFFLRRQSAELQHFLCRCVLYSFWLLPAVNFTVPPLRHSFSPEEPTRITVFSDRPTVLKRNTIASAITVTITPVRYSRFPWTLWIAPAYSVVTLALLLRLAHNISRLLQLVRRSQPIFDSDFRELAQEIWLRSLARYRPQIRVSEEVHVPMAVGIHELTILLPAQWQTWPHEKRRAVLAHEMAHVRREDPQTAFLASLTACFFWLNPMLYWLRRQLREQAERACDEAALTEVRPNEYAQMLVEFAALVRRNGSRLTVASTAAIHRSLTRKRIEHIFSIRKPQGGNHFMARTGLVVVLVPALYLTASVRFDQEPGPAVKTENTAISIANQQQADQLESQLREDPENLSLRQALMLFYVNERNNAALVSHLLWMIEHHPEAPMASLPVYHVLPQLGPLADSLAAHNSTAVDYERLKTAWEDALLHHSDSPDALYNAGLFLQGEDSQRALSLFTEAQQLTPANDAKQARYLQAISAIYAAALISDGSSGNGRTLLNNMAMNSALAAKLRTALDTSNDPALLSQVGTMLVQFRRDEEGLSLLQRAIDLDPTNPQWKEALEWAQAEPARRRAIQQLTTGTPGNAVQIGSQAAASNLVKKVDPIYPALAQQARISGTVEFTVGIGTDGKVESLQLVRGHPLLVNAAKDAVLQWVYRPTLLNGNPVAVTTTVQVPFRMALQ